jgi:hypothetical protein
MFSSQRYNIYTGSGERCCSETVDRLECDSWVGGQARRRTGVLTLTAVVPAVAPAALAPAAPSARAYSGAAPATLGAFVSLFDGS